MSNKRRVVVTLHHRDELSLGGSRSRLCHEAYHWGILIMPKNSRGADCNAYDVTNASKVDPRTRRDLNPGRNWYFRPKHGVDPLRSGRLIGRIVIGKVPPNVTTADIDAILATIPLPNKNTHPPETCVIWTLRAIVALQRAGIAWSFDVGKFRDWALAFADKGMIKTSPKHMIEYRK